MPLTLQNVSFNIHDKRLLDNICLQAQPNKVTGIIGPNGSGKSTLLKNIYRMHRPSSGVILLGSKAIHELSPRQAAQRVAVLSQEPAAVFGFTVKETVLMGRNPHKSLLSSDTFEDDEQVLHALEKVGMAHSLDRDITTLSGGEKQRVLLARALVQNARLLILDEPNNNLDIHYQLQIMELIQQLHLTVLITLHDLNMAARYCHYLHVLHHGQLVASGTPRTVLTPKLLRDIFEVHAHVEQNAENKQLSIHYLSPCLPRSEIGDVHPAQGHTK